MEQPEQYALSMRIIADDARQGPKYDEPPSMKRWRQQENIEFIGNLTIGGTVHDLYHALLRDPVTGVTVDSENGKVGSWVYLVHQSGIAGMVFMELVVEYVPVKRE